MESTVNFFEPETIALESESRDRCFTVRNGSFGFRKGHFGFRNGRFDPKLSFQNPKRLFQTPKRLFRCSKQRCYRIRSGCFAVSESEMVVLDSEATILDSEMAVAESETGVWGEKSIQTRWYFLFLQPLKNSHQPPWKNLVGVRRTVLFFVFPKWIPWIQDSHCTFSYVDVNVKCSTST